MTNKKKLAYVRVIDKLKLPEEYHRGRKLMTAQKEEIKQLYKEGGWTYRKLAELYDVAYGTIQCTINSQAYQQMIEAGERYRRKTKRKKTNSMELRRRKKKLVLEGKINLKK